MSNADADWTYVTVSSGDATTQPTDTNYAFSNVLANGGVDFGSNRVQVALFSMSYELKAAPSNTTFSLATDVVRGTQIVGNSATNILRIETLLPGKNTYTPAGFLQWVPAVVTGQSLGSIIVVIKNVDGTDPTDFVGNTYVTMAFRTVE